MTLDEALRDLIREEVRAAVGQALEGVDLAVVRDDEPLASKVWEFHPETRLSISEVAEVLSVSTRSVRRYIKGETMNPKLPADSGPAGLWVSVGDLTDWMRDCELAAEHQGRQ